MSGDGMFYEQDEQWRREQAEEPATASCAVVSMLDAWFAEHETLTRANYAGLVSWDLAGARWCRDEVSDE